MVNITKEQLNNIETNKPLGLVKIDDVEVEDLGVEKYNVIEDYDYDGHTIKNFYRVNSSVFKSVFEEIRNNPECSFVTPYNDIIKEGLIPEKVSVLIKDTYCHLEERIASQILNFYGVACPVNLSVVGGEIFQDDIGYMHNKERAIRLRNVSSGLTGLYPYSVSIDFMSEGDRIETFTKGEYGDVTFFSNLNDSMDIVKCGIGEVINSGELSKAGKLAKQHLSTQLEEEFVMSLLVRKVICCDSDFNSNNVAILVGKSTRIINYDFELSLGKHVDKGRAIQLFQNVKAKYPKVWGKFRDKTLELHNNLSQADDKEKRKVFKSPQISKALEDNAKFVTNCSMKLIDNPTM